MGTFASPDFQFGIPVAVAKPRDNKMPIWDSALLALNLNNQDLADLQSRIADLYATLRGSRDYRR
jgi:hypothetical protein